MRNHAEDICSEELQCFDVVVAGGGLAGLCLAIQIKRTRPKTRILVVEKNTLPLPAAAHKVGESSVEMASHYFTDVLGLSKELGSELLKFGLRFFLGDGAKGDIASRLEFGPGHYLPVPSYQIDRGQFENQLLGKAESIGIDLALNSRVVSTEIGESNAPHRVVLNTGGEERSQLCRWIVDASGRASLLKKKLGLSRANRHDVNAVWFRMDAVIDIDTWSKDSTWRQRVSAPRRLSTNHLMGKGYWVWLIPLADDRTSIGIVTDASLHPFSELHTYAQARAWLEIHEPQFAAVLDQLDQEPMDFLVLKDYSHDVKQMFSSERWCLTGDAGVFLDPFYSPGSDFIAVANGFASDLICRDLGGQDVSKLAQVYDEAFFALSRNTLGTYQRQYALMGCPEVMCAKIVWDFAIYWGSLALLFFRDKLCDSEFMAKARPLLTGFAYTNLSVQGFFRRWSNAMEQDRPVPGIFIDYAEIGFLAEMNRDLVGVCDDANLHAKLEGNLLFVRELEREIIAEAARDYPELANGAAAPASSHLDQMFATLRAGRTPDEVNAG